MAHDTADRLTDEKLLELLREEDDYAAFTELYHRYWRTLLTAAGKRIGDIEVAQELVQDVFVSFFRRRHNIQVTTSVEAYFKAALRNQVFKVYRSLRINEAYLQEQAAQETMTETPEQLLEARQLREEVLRVASQMPEKCREVFLYSRFEQLSHQEIAERLGISIHTVKRHINRALDILRKELKDQELNLFLVGLFIYFNN